MTDAEVREAKRIALAHRLLEVISKEEWQNIVVPYLKDEQSVLIESMASQVDALQLMRYAGSMQTLNSLIHLEAKCRQAVNQHQEKKMSQIKN